MVQQRAFIAVVTFPETDILIKSISMGFLKHKDLFNALHSLLQTSLYHTLLRSSRQVNTSCQIQASQEHTLSNPAGLHALQQSSTRLKEGKKTTSLCVAVHLLLSSTWQCLNVHTRTFGMFLKLYLFLSNTEMVLQSVKAYQLSQRFGYSILVTH